MKYFIGGIILGAIVVAVLVAIDLTLATPAAPTGGCVLVRNLILPDRCLSSCRSGVDCPTSRTRPYMMFWTQPAACPDGVICG